jgi:hypothetical protein
MLHDLKIFQKSYEFLFWIKQITQKFAKAHKYALGAQLESEMLELIKLIARANMARDKRELVEECLVRHEMVRLLVRTSKDFKLITLRQYEYASERLVEMGKMLGGWRRYSGGGVDSRLRSLRGLESASRVSEGRRVRIERQSGFIRGSNWNNGANDGAFTLNLNNAPSNSNTNIGFRCARFSGDTRQADTRRAGRNCALHGSRKRAVLPQMRILSRACMGEI